MNESYFLAYEIADISTSHQHWLIPTSGSKYYMYNIFIVHSIPRIWILKVGKREHWNWLLTTSMYQKIMHKFALIQPFNRVLWIQGIPHLVGGSWKIDARKVLQGEWALCVWVQELRHHQFHSLIFLKDVSSPWYEAPVMGTNGFLHMVISIKGKSAPAPHHTNKKLPTDC